MYAKAAQNVQAALVGVNHNRSKHPESYHYIPSTAAPANVKSVRGEMYD